MPLFNVTVREHTYTGQIYTAVVQAETCEEALQLAAEQATAPQPPAAGPQQQSTVAAPNRTDAGQIRRTVAPAQPGGNAPQPTAQQATAPQPPPAAGPQRGFSVAVTEHTDAGRIHHDVVQAQSCEEALRLAAEQAMAPKPPPVPRPQSQTANRPGCADVWVYSLLHCELAAGHDPPHLAVARGYGRVVRWVRDDRGLAHALPEPAAGPAATSSISQPPAAQKKFQA